MAACRRHRRVCKRAIPIAPMLLGALALLGSVLAPRPAAAQIGSDRYSSIVVDARTGAVLEQVDPDALRHPASLAKLMTLYLTFEALRDRRISLDEDVPVSENAASMEPTKLGLTPESRITVEQAIMGIVTRSANDAAAALGEMLGGGSEARFAQLMTLRARALGMRRSTFTNASGLPDPDAWTTAGDMAMLARRLVTDFPGFYHYFSTPSFVFRGQVIFNHDNMLKSYPGVDGLKTGYTNASGHNLVTSAVRGGTRLIGVELGCATNGERDAHMAVLLNAGFTQEGVPVTERPLVMARAIHFPSLISSARAAEAERRPEHLRVVAQVHAPVAQRWAVQVGSFASERAARVAAAHARRATTGGAARVEHATPRGREAWRAQVVGLTPGEALSTCASLARHRTPCAVIHPEGHLEASL